MRRFSIVFALVLFTLLNVGSVFAEQPVMMKSIFRSRINTIIADSDNLETVVFDAGNGYNILHSEDVENLLVQFGTTGETNGYMSLTTDWDYENMLEAAPDKTPFQCVGFVKAGSVLDDEEGGRPSKWIKGPALTSTSFPESGTVVATFYGPDRKKGTEDDGPYGGHTAFFLGGNSSKIILLEQNGKHPGSISIRPISFADDNAGDYHVVKQ